MVNGFNDEQLHGQNPKQEQRGWQVHPAIFGQNQIKNGFGPVYGIPPFPWQNGIGQNPMTVPWQHAGGQMQGGFPWQHGGMGPSGIPWQQGGMGPSGFPWQQGGSFGPSFPISSEPW